MSPKLSPNITVIQRAVPMDPVVAELRALTDSLVRHAPNSNALALSAFVTALDFARANPTVADRLLHHIAGDARVLTDGPQLTRRFSTLLDQLGAETVP